MEEKKDKIKIGIGAWIAFNFLYHHIIRCIQNQRYTTENTGFDQLNRNIWTDRRYREQFYGKRGEAAPKMVSWQASICCQASCSFAGCWASLNR